MKRPSTDAGHSGPDESGIGLQQALMTFTTPQTGNTDQTKLDMQHQLETLYILAKSRQLEATQSAFFRPVFGKKPTAPRLLERMLLRISAKRRRLRMQIILRESGLFNDEWYLLHYPDVAVGGMDPAVHYLKHGAGELRDPGPDFSTRHYLSMYPDVRDHGINPLLHYLYSGWDELRIIRPSILHRV